MASPQGSVTFFVTAYAAATAVAPGNLVMPISGTDGWVVATAAALGTTRCSGIAVSVTNGSGFGTVEIWQGGSIDPSITGLGTGTASWVRCSATGVPERFTPVNAGTSDIIGYCETDGRLHLLMGVITETIALATPGGGGGSTPTGTGLRKVVSGTENAAASLLVNADVDPAAAIAGTKVAPDFGAQNVSTTGRVVLGSNQTALQGNGATLNIGQDNAGGTQFTNVQVYPSTSVTLGVGAAPYVSLIGSIINALKPVACGAGTVASSGDIRLSATGQINFDRGGSNILGLWMDTGTSLGVGNSNATAVTAYSGGSINLSATSAVTVTGTSVNLGAPLAGYATAFKWAKATMQPTSTNAMTLTSAQYASPILLFKSGGGVTAATTVTMPNLDGEAHIVKNRCGFNVIIGGVTIATGTDAHISYDSDAAAWGRST